MTKWVWILEKTETRFIRLSFSQKSVTVASWVTWKCARLLSNYEVCLPSAPFCCASGCSSWLSRKHHHQYNNMINWKTIRAAVLCCGVFIIYRMGVVGEGGKVLYHYNSAPSLWPRNTSRPGKEKKKNTWSIHDKSVWMVQCMKSFPTPNECSLMLYWQVVSYSSKVHSSYRTL